MKNALLGFLLGALIAGVSLGAVIYLNRGTVDRLRIELESADQALIRGGKRVVFVVREIETVRTEIRVVREGIGAVQGGLRKVSDLAADGLGILRTVRAQRMD
jgi:hypothetical protein